MVAYTSEYPVKRRRALLRSNPSRDNRLPDENARGPRPRGRGPLFFALRRHRILRCFLFGPCLGKPILAPHVAIR